VSGVPLPNESLQVVAHRGASGRAPETTLAAYREALHLKADFLEADVQMTRDGEIIAIHDESVDRTTNGKGPVRQMTLAELKGLDAGSWFNKMYPDRARPDYAGQKIPTLQEIMDMASESPAGLYIEIKNPELYPPHLESDLIHIIRRNGFEKRVVIQSFSPRSVEKVKALDPSVPAALLVDALENDPVEATVRAHANELAIDHKLATRDIVQKAHERGLTVAVWTVDEHEDLKRMIGLGIDAIITDYPDRLNRLLGK
jgi:glycerophosphoryl diester phosphodiesterase